MGSWTRAGVSTGEGNPGSLGKHSLERAASQKGAARVHPGPRSETTRRRRRCCALQCGERRRGRRCEPAAFLCGVQLVQSVRQVRREGVKSLADTRSLEIVRPLHMYMYMFMYRSHDDSRARFHSARGSNGDTPEVSRRPIATCAVTAVWSKGRAYRCRPPQLGRHHQTTF